MNTFLGMKILWIFILGHHKTGLVLGVISMHLRVFSFFSGMPDISDFFFVSSRCWVQAYV